MEEARRSVAREVVDVMVDLSKRATTDAELVDNKLAPVARPAIPQVESELKNEPPLQEYPPLFNEMRAHLLTIEEALRRIEDTLTRTEL